MFTVDAHSQKITNCENVFSCLTEGKCGDRDMCDVNYANGEHVLFLHNREQTICKYRSAYGYSQICTCPTRFAIYRKYKQ